MKNFLLQLLVLSSIQWAFSKTPTQDFCQFNGQPIISKETQGLETTKPWIVTRELQQGQDFQCEAWIKEKNLLESLGIFAEVNLGVQAEGEGVALTYEFKELLPWLLLPAAKQSDQAGWMVGPGIAAVNLFGRDIFVQAFYRTDVTPKFNTTNEFLMNVRSPYVGDLPLNYNFAWVKLDTYNPLKEYNENSHDINLILRYPIWKELEVLTFGGAFIVNRDTTLGFARDEGSSKSPSIGGGFLWDAVDNITNPRSGMYQEVSYRVQGEALGGSVEGDFSETLWDQRFYASAGDHILASSSLLRWRRGRVPFYETYEPGGANSFRAWMPGPENSGESEVLANVEYRYELVPKTTMKLPFIDQSGYWGLQPVLGVDAVSLWSREGNDDINAYGYYGGLHILIPAINRIRIEVGNEFARNNWVVQVGLFEKTFIQRWRLR